jgi:lysozyme
VNVRELINSHEGRIAYAYKDSLGFLTIGVGHLVDGRKGGKLPEHIIDALLDHDIKTHSDDLFKALPWALSLDPIRQAVLIDMVFNLGVTGLLAFKETLRHFQNANWTAAAVAMLDSTWAKQVGRRAAELALMTRTGEWQ